MIDCWGVIGFIALDGMHMQLQYEDELCLKEHLSCATENVMVI